MNVAKETVKEWKHTDSNGEIEGVERRQKGTREGEGRREGDTQSEWDTRTMKEEGGRRRRRREEGDLEFKRKIVGRGDM